MSFECLKNKSVLTFKENLNKDDFMKLRQRQFVIKDHKKRVKKQVNITFNQEGCENSQGNSSQEVENVYLQPYLYGKGKNAFRELQVAKNKNEYRKRLIRLSEFEDILLDRNKVVQVSSYFSLKSIEKN